MRFGWRRARRPAAATAAVVLAVALAAPAPARAQGTPPAQPSTAQPAASGNTVRISREEAIRLALENNPDLAADRYDPLASAAEVAAARGAFVPAFSSGIDRNSQKTPSPNVFTGTGSTQTDVVSGNAGVGQLLRWGGGRYDVSFNSARATTDNPFTAFTPSVTSSLQAVFRSRCCGTQDQATRGQTSTSARGIRRSPICGCGDGWRARRPTRSRRMLFRLARAAWTRAASLDLALELERSNKARSTSPVAAAELVSARAEVAQRRENLIIARTRRSRPRHPAHAHLDPKRADYWAQRSRSHEVPPAGPRLISTPPSATRSTPGPISPR